MRVPVVLVASVVATLAFIASILVVAAVSAGPSVAALPALVGTIALDYAPVLLLSRAVTLDLAAPAPQRDARRSTMTTALTAGGLGAVLIVVWAVVASATPWAAAVVVGIGGLLMVGAVVAARVLSAPAARQ